MQKLILLVLVGVWAAVLLPPALRSRSAGRPGDSISDFHRRLDILRRTGFDGPRRRPAPRHPSPAPHRSVTRGPAPTRRTPVVVGGAARRRRNVFVGLLVSSGVTFVLAVLAGGALWLAFLVTLVLLGAYVMLLVHIRNAAAARISLAEVRHIDLTGTGEQPRLQLVRTASR